jgi:transposase-like protein
MATIKVRCPHCGSHNVVKYGKQPNGTQRYRCQNQECERRIFLLEYQNRETMPEIKRQIIEMALNGTGIRETARRLGVSPATVIEVFEMIASFGAAFRHPSGQRG